MAALVGSQDDFLVGCEGSKGSIRSLPGLQQLEEIVSRVVEGNVVAGGCR